MRVQIAVVSLLATVILAPLSARQAAGPSPIVLHARTGKHIEIDLSIVNNCRTAQTVDLLVDGMTFPDMPLFVSVDAGEQRRIRLSGTTPSSLTTAGSAQTANIVFAFRGAPSCPRKVTEQPVIVSEVSTIAGIDAAIETVSAPEYYDAAIMAKLNAMRAKLAEGVPSAADPDALSPSVAEMDFALYDNGLYFNTTPSDVAEGGILAAAIEDSVVSNQEWVDEAASEQTGQWQGATSDGALEVPTNASAQGVSGANLQLLHAFAFKTTSRWQTPAPTRPLTVYLTSLGRSTGDAFTLTALNHGRAPVSLNFDNLVLEPVRGVATARAAREIANHRGGRLTTTLTAYCLEFLKAPPIAGTLFRVADRRGRDKFSRFGHIVAASRRMQRYGLLPPDGGDARAYFHSIRQWAIWTQEQGFDEKRFGDAFVQHTRKNAEQAGRRWTDAFETAARSLVPGRWRAVQFALQEAGRFERSQQTAGRRGR